MRIKSYASALLVGGLVMAGGLAASPPFEEGEHPSENGCRGVNEAQENADDAAQAALDKVEDLISDDDCADHPPAGSNGNRPSDDS